MKILLASLFAGLLSVAAAQMPPADPATAPATPGDLVSAAPTSTALWATASVTLRHTPADAAPATGQVEAGEQVQLVLAEGDWYRVLQGTTLGWVPASAVSLVPPAPPEGSLDLGALGLQGLQGLQGLPPLGGKTPLTAPKKGE